MATTPAEFRSRLGRITAEKTIPQLKKFAESGGSIYPLAYGMSKTAAVDFDSSPVFRLDPDAAAKHTAAVA